MDQRDQPPPKISRRTMILTALGASAVAIAGGAYILPRLMTGGKTAALNYIFPDGLMDQGFELPPTPSCADGQDEATASQTEGPYYTPRTPERTTLIEPGVTGTSLVILGRVLTPGCRPIPGAVLDFWQADAEGEYDNEGYRLRGHQFADRQGQFRLETIRPAAYGGIMFLRTPHIHVKVQGPRTPLLTTQLYFPGERLNEQDGIFDNRLMMDVQKRSDRLEARFDFVLPTQNT